MAETTIEWCDYTFNPWTGCTKVTPGCANCYAEPIAKRFSLGSWGPVGERKIASESYWQHPLRWNRAAEKSVIRRKVFCASMADVFEDRAELNAPCARLFSMIAQTPHLDWLLLTKRPENFQRMLTCGWMLEPFRNVWLGVSVEDQQRADERIPLLLQTPAAVRFLSVEPLLGPVDLCGKLRHCPEHDFASGFCVGPCPARRKIDWVIVGGESGPHARPTNIEWIRSIVRQCEEARVACFVKQLGSSPRPSALPSDVSVRFVKDRKGADMSEWPEDLRVRQFPEMSR